MGVDVEVFSSWDDEAIGVDKFGPIEEDAISTWGHPFEAAARFAGVDGVNYRLTGSYPFAVLDTQIKHSDVDMRAYETGQYLSQVHEDSLAYQRNEPQPDRSPQYIDWRDVNKHITGLHRTFAARIRAYYKSKLTMLRMQDADLTPWQEEMFTIVCRQDTQMFKQREIGMLSRIVQAFEVDLEIDRVVDIWGDPTPEKWCPGHWNKRARAVGGAKRMGKKDMSVFVVDDENSELFELVLNRNPLNKFFVDTLRNQDYTGFKFIAMNSNRREHISEKGWTVVHHPKIEVA